MTEYQAPTEQEASEAAIALANEYRELQRSEAEKYREAPPAESEEDFLERVRTVSETSAGGFSAPYIRPLEEITDEVSAPESVESQISDDQSPPDQTVSTSAGETDLGDLIEPNREARAVFGQQDDPSFEARASFEENQAAIVPEETPRSEVSQAEAPVTEVESNDQTTVVDTGYTDPNQIETAQSIVNAQLDAEAEEKGESKPTETAEPVDNTEEKELSYAEKRNAIVNAQTTEELDKLLEGEERQPLLKAAEKRRAEL